METEKPIIIKLTQDQYDTLINDLYELGSYRWNDDKCHADNSRSAVLGIIEEQRYTT